MRQRDDDVDALAPQPVHRRARRVLGAQEAQRRRSARVAGSQREEPAFSMRSATSWLRASPVGKPESATACKEATKP